MSSDHNHQTAHASPPPPAGSDGQRGKSTGFLRRFDSLGWRILFWMALVALVPLLIMASQGYHCARQALVESEVAHLHSVLASRTARLESRFNNFFRRIFVAF